MSTSNVFKLSSLVTLCAGGFRGLKFQISICIRFKSVAIRILNYSVGLFQFKVCTHCTAYALCVFIIWTCALHMHIAHTPFIQRFSRNFVQDNARFSNSILFVGCIGWLNLSIFESNSIPINRCVDFLILQFPWGNKGKMERWNGYEIFVRCLVPKVTKILYWIL